MHIFTYYVFFQTIMSRKESVIWDYFTPINDTSAKCGICKVEKKHAISSTSNLRRHMTTRHPTINLSTRRRVVQDDDEEEERILNEVRMYLNKNSGNYYVCIYIIDIQNTDYNIM